LNVQGGWYHIVARGIERRSIFQDDRDRGHFLELLEEMTLRYGAEIHAYVLMGNHYHLIIRTPHANVSLAIQWLNVSYSVWFNRRLGRVGHVFQGRFGSTLIDSDGSWALNASIYLHLNPVRLRSLGLGKRENRIESCGLSPPDLEQIKSRLKMLSEYRWSSYRAYAGYESPKKWLTVDELLNRAGGSRNYRRLVQAHVTRGTDPGGFETVGGRIALGTQAFLEHAKTLTKNLSKEHNAKRQTVNAVALSDIVLLVEKKLGRKWDDFAHRYGDPGRDLVLYLARRRSGMTMAQIAKELGDLDYRAAAKAAQRFEASLASDKTKRSLANNCLAQLSYVQT